MTEPSGWTMLALILGNAAITIPLVAWTRMQRLNDHQQIYDLLTTIKRDMQAFHNRLAAIKDNNKQN